MPRQQGYILVTVLALVALLALLAARLDARVAQYREALGGWMRHATAQAQFFAAREEVLLAIATRQLSPFGFGPGPAALRVDGRPYRLPSGVLVSLQDARGLISISTPDPVVLRNFLLRHGVTDAEVEPLLDKLADYADIDSLHRLNGAEKEDYARLNLPPPRNDWPISSYELGQIAGWAERPALWRQAGDFFSARRDNEINPNTAPPEVLLALPGATPEGVAALIAQRELKHFDSVAAVAAASGIRLSPAHETFYPGLLYRLRLWLPEDGTSALEYTLLLSPGSPRLPWQILEARTVDRPITMTEAHAISPFPLAPAAADTP